MRRELFRTTKFHWVDLSHPSPEELQSITREYGLHPVMVQDTMEPAHLPKFEKTNDITFAILRVYDVDALNKADSVPSLTRKIALFIGPDFVISIHRMDPSRFQDLIGRCLSDFSPNEEPSVSILLVKLLNRAYSTYQIPIERAEQDLDTFELELFEKDANLKILSKIHVIKRRLSLIKRILLHSQDVIHRMFPPSEVSPIYQDLRENIAQLIFLTDELLEDVHSLFNLQLGLSSHKTNEVMRVLTIFSVFFMPLTFIVGIYGMNFKFQPEFEWAFGYSYVWALIIVVTLLISIWFYRKGWLKSFTTDE